MNVENLRTNHPKLISYMETAGYSKAYIGRILKEIQWLLAETDTMGWVCYSDVYRYYEAIPLSPGNLEKKTCIHRRYQGIRPTRQISRREVVGACGEGCISKAGTRVQVAD